MKRLAIIPVILLSAAVAFAQAPAPQTAPPAQPQAYGTPANPLPIEVYIENSQASRSVGYAVEGMISSDPRFKLLPVTSINDGKPYVLLDILCLTPSSNNSSNLGDVCSVTAEWFIAPFKNLLILSAGVSILQVGPNAEADSQGVFSGLVSDLSDINKFFNGAAVSLVNIIQAAKKQ